MSSLLSPPPDKINRNIDIYEANYELPEWFYEKCQEEFRKVNLCKIDERDIKRIISPFLSNWGMMGRVIFNKNRVGWERKLAKIITDKCEVFKELRKKNLAEVNLDGVKSEVKISYKKIAELIGPTSASKVLHLICPKFFPMWDVAIRDAISKEVKKRNKSKFGIGSGATGYFKFMNALRGCIKKNKQTLLQLQQKYHKSLVKLCDEYFWRATHQDR
jgi:hypothetical protein